MHSIRVSWEFSSNCALSNAISEEVYPKVYIIVLIMSTISRNQSKKKITVCMAGQRRDFLRWLDECDDG